MQMKLNCYQNRVCIQLWNINNSPETDSWQLNLNISASTSRCQYFAAYGFKRSRESRRFSPQRLQTPETIQSGEVNKRFTVMQMCWDVREQQPGNNQCARFDSLVKPKRFLSCVCSPQRLKGSSKKKLGEKAAFFARNTTRTLAYCAGPALKIKCPAGDKCAH